MPDHRLLKDRYETLLARIGRAEAASGRPPGSTRLLAVGKTRDAGEIRALAALGQRCFGENYLQEAEEKIMQLRDISLEWHFIGRIQSNKTRPIAEHFDWVHSLASLKHARRLSAQRPPHLPPLNICLQVNISKDPAKAGVASEALPELARAIAPLERLKLRGLMAIPSRSSQFEQQRRPFHDLRNCFEDLQGQGFALDTLSMGMSNDMEAAIAEGATMVRIGTDIFGTRT